MNPWTPPPSVQLLIERIIQTVKPAKLVLFGSRARGDFRGNSDIDLCVFHRHCTDREWNELLISIEEDPHTLFTVELVEFETLSKVYQDAIRKDGVTLYESHA